ncbi:ABC transporter substrate-binding protein [Dactylosporangium vinaceum]|uniref:ABC transporter substrate-binding protein n=1 Tax=Dactylosporangium vinaceum TaxID=53362 RepID=A0ABV5MDK6_9ACTN|nr:ABC transporter substrate-binding protein [Dactylosporangium vinaceum]UAC01123.1 ABC transporter substrate-binding protein [Dactylosporangium vinaceum]
MRTFTVAACATTAALGLLLAGCTGGGDTAATPSAAANSDSVLSYNETEPASPLVPGDTAEVGGIGILGALFNGLIEYDAKTAAPRNAVAESINSPDSKVWTIKLKPNWTFQDGTKVTAKSFVDAWNYTAYSPNLMKNASYMSHIQGFDQVNNIGKDGKQPATLPPAKEMSGLKVVDDQTFTATLSAPFSGFGLQLGFAAFYPMPASFFTDRKAYEAHPVGNGPFQFVSYTKGTNLLVKRFDGYAGAQKAKVSGIDFRFYTDLDKAYADVLADKLDYLSFTPWTASQGNKIEKDLPASRRASYAYVGHQAIAFPLFDQRYSDKRVRQAISMAIDRTALIKEVFNGKRTPADGIVPPNAQGYVANQCGELCSYQPQKAKELFDASGFQGPVTLTSNVDSGNQEWVEVACRSIQQALGRPCEFKPQTTLGAFRTALTNKSIHEIYRTAWVAGYPSIENFLNPLFRTNGSGNVGQYSNPRVDALLAKADAAPSQGQAFSLYQEAERQALDDMQTVPIWYQSATAAWSTRVHNAQPTQFRELEFTTVTLGK